MNKISCLSSILNLLIKSVTALRLRNCGLGQLVSRQSIPINVNATCKLLHHVSRLPKASRLVLSSYQLWEQGGRAYHKERTEAALSTQLPSRSSGRLTQIPISDDPHVMKFVSRNDVREGARRNAYVVGCALAGPCLHRQPA